MIIDLLFRDPLSYFMAAVSIILALSIHEYAHAQASDSLGDNTARDMGRLTINPLSHLEPIGAILILTLGFGWGKPVPFNPLNLRNKKWGPAMVAIAGPGSNFFMAIVVGFLLRTGIITNPGLIKFFLTFIWLNVLLGVFNLIPVPPLDGSHLLSVVLGRKAEGYRMLMMQGSVFTLFFAILFMMYVGVPLIANPIFNLIVGAGIF